MIPNIILQFSQTIMLFNQNLFILIDIIVTIYT